MPTVVAPENRKLAFRRRIRTNKQEQAALDAFIVLVEKLVRERQISHAAELRGRPDVEAIGFKYLGGGVFKTAFKVPGGRWVVKMPHNLERMVTDPEGFVRRAAKDVTIEARQFTNASPEIRELLAPARELTPWATLQEMASMTVAKAKKEAEAKRDRKLVDEIDRKVGELRHKWLGFGLQDRDLHGENIAIRKDGSVAIIDYALERI